MTPTMYRLKEEPCDLSQETLRVLRVISDCWYFRSLSLRLDCCIAQNGLLYVCISQYIHIALESQCIHYFPYPFFFLILHYLLFSQMVKMYLILAQWTMLVIPVCWRRESEDHKFKDRLSYIKRHSQNTKVF